MTLEELRKLVREWDLNSPGGRIASSQYQEILNLLDYHAKREWRVYLPAEHPQFNASLMERLARWIGNASDEADQKLLLEYAVYISFFSHDDFIALYRAALDREVKRWIAAQINGRLDGAGWRGFGDTVEREVYHHTWFCPVTDSMDINEFHKATLLPGSKYRPAFLTLQMLAEGAAVPDATIATNLLHYMANPSLDPRNPLPSFKRIVLLEDMVGSGTQCYRALQWAVQHLQKPILFTPLILCPKGATNLRSLENASNGLLAVRPIIELRPQDLLGPERKGVAGWHLADTFERFADRCSNGVQFSYPTFGFEDTGCSLVTFSNTPDNTLPLVHDSSNGQWSPLFPRVYRGGD